MLANNIRGGAILLSVIVALLFLSFDPTAQASAPDITVTTTSDVADFGGLQQVADLPGPDGVVSLREAITATNNTPGPQVVGFAIPTSDSGFDGSVFSIKPLSPLPPLVDNGTTIDGATQTGNVGDTNPAGPEIEVSGSLETSGQDGIDVFSADNVINSLVINRFGFPCCGSGVVFGGAQATRNVITGCFVGVDASGTAIAGNASSGVLINGDASNNRVGGPNHGERNIISGNGLDGVNITFGPTGNRVEGNFIGTDVIGSAALGNGRDGVNVDTASNNIVGGPDASRRNIISGNLRSGVFLVGGALIADQNVVQGNFVGMDVTGMNALGNQERGVSIVSQIGTNVRNSRIVSNLISSNAQHGIGIFSSDGNLIEANLIGTDINGNPSFGNGQFGVSIAGGPGGPSSSGNRVSGNVIAANALGGVTVSGEGVKNAISRNSIFSNQGLGIQLGPDFPGIVPNDPGDFDTGPNDLMNFPLLEHAHATAGRLVVQGVIDTQNPRAVTIEFFANPVPTPGGDPSGHGEGAIFIGATRPNPLGEFTAALPPVPVGTIISATATDADGNTSGFAENIVASFP